MIFFARSFKKILFRLLFVNLLFISNLYAQVTIQGKVYSDLGNKPVEFGSIIVPEKKMKTRINPDGSYQLTFDEAGKYTVYISSPGLRPLKKTISVQSSQNLNFRLNATAIRGGVIKIRAERNIQKVSRNTISKQEIKDAPATLGDAIGALATLPGVIRPAGFFGPLIIRGADDTANRYFIDDIPVLNPQHFGGLQSIISNDLIREIDLYSSAFPSKYGNTIGAVIDINTVDEVKRLGGFVDIGIISANFYLQSLWGQNRNGKVNVSSKNDLENAAPQEASSKDGHGGYWITSGRIGYLTLIVPYIVELITGDPPPKLPQYYDYQLKGKINLDSKGHHGLTALFFGSYDTFKVTTKEPTDKEKEELKEEGVDPLFLVPLKFNNRIFNNSVGLYYDYNPSKRLSNRLMTYGTFSRSIFYIDQPRLQSASSLTINVNSEPNVAGLKDRFRWEWWEEIAEIRTAFEYEIYFFRSSGQSQALVTPLLSTGQPDLGNPNIFQVVPLDGKLHINHLVASYLENKFTFDGFKLIPGVRADYLHLTKKVTLSPRALISYELPTQTTFSIAGGQYYSYPQINFFYFNQPFDQQPQVTYAKYIKPEQSIHRVVGVEQRFLNDYSIKAEAFLNNFKSLLSPIDGTQNNGRNFSNDGAAMAKGIEILFRKAQTEAEYEFYGWLSYTYTRATQTLNQVTTPFEYEQPHSLKLIFGYRFGSHNIGTRFELYSGFPYTPIVGSQCTPSFNCSDPDNTRYSKVYSNDGYSARFQSTHRLDVRYTYIENVSWGQFRAYVEIINIYNYTPKNNLDWNYNKPYKEGENPTINGGSDSLSIIPNFGVEFRF